MRVVGYIESNFVPRNSEEEIKGYSVYLTLPIDQAGGKGMMTDKIYLSQRRLAADGLDINTLLGKDIQVIYNKMGKIAKIAEN